MAIYNFGTNFTIIGMGSDKADKAAKALAGQVANHITALNEADKATPVAPVAKATPAPKADLSVASALASAQAKLQDNEAMQWIAKGVQGAHKSGKLSHDRAHNLLTMLSCKMGMTLCQASQLTSALGDKVIPCTIIPETSNTKLGTAMDAMTTSYNRNDDQYHSCPNSCIHAKAHTCYAEFGQSRGQWNRASDANDPRYAGDVETLVTKVIAAFLEQAKAKAKYAAKNEHQSFDVIYRGSSAGDMAISGTNDLNTDYLNALAWSLKQAQDFTNEVYGSAYDVKYHAYSYTHCKQSLIADKAIRDAHDKYGFTLNYSANTLDEVESARRANMPVVYSTVDYEKDAAELAKRGIKAVKCSNQTNGTSCAKCLKCAKFDRDSVILFQLHGTRAKTGAIKFKMLQK